MHRSKGGRPALLVKLKAIWADARLTAVKKELSDAKERGYPSLTAVVDNTGGSAAHDYGNKGDTEIIIAPMRARGKKSHRLRSKRQREQEEESAKSPKKTKKKRKASDVAAPEEESAKAPQKPKKRRKVTDVAASEATSPSEQVSETANEPQKRQRSQTSVPASNTTQRRQRKASAGLDLSGDVYRKDYS